MTVLRRIALVGLGLGAALAVAAALWFRFQLADAEGARDVARAELARVELALEHERISTKAAADAADRLAAEVANQGARCEAALNELAGQAARYRRQLRLCMDPIVLQARLGALFPAPAPASRPAWGL